MSQLLAAIRSHDNRGDICTSSELAPFLLRAFNLASNFSEEKRCKKDYKEFNKKWKTQDKVDFQKKPKKNKK
jgi:hypothetical protein